jgi:hypothetical protein
MGYGLGPLSSTPQELIELLNDEGVIVDLL